MLLRRQRGGFGGPMRRIVGAGESLGHKRVLHLECGHTVLRGLLSHADRTQCPHCRVRRTATPLWMQALMARGSLDPRALPG